jgi:predicted O-methyltransferase YrrM
MMNWTADRLLELARSYRPATVFAAAADLDLFSALAAEPLTARALSRKLGCDLRALSTLLDALTALEFLVKHDERYSLPAGADTLLTAAGPDSILAMAQHQANCLRRWAQLAQVVKTGRPAERIASVRGAAGDQEAFISAMHSVSAPMADRVVQALPAIQFRHLLDVGGASGTWTMAFLRVCPTATATLFDLPDVLPMARRRLTDAGLADRVRLVAGDFTKDTLPPGADLAWVSAVVHQNSREQNRQLFARVFRALLPAGWIAIRDILMDPSRTRPVAGALFAVNMLVGTKAGGTFTFHELREDLEAAGFVGPAVTRQEEGMNSIVIAGKAGEQGGRLKSTEQQERRRPGRGFTN